MFNINGLMWNIFLVDPYHPMLIRNDGSITIGSCDLHTQTVYLSNALDKDLLKKVLIHEVAHAAIFSYNIILCPYYEEIIAMLIDTHGQEIITTANLLFEQLIK